MGEDFVPKDPVSYILIHGHPSRVAPTFKYLRVHMLLQITFLGRGYWGPVLLLLPARKLLGVEATGKLDSCCPVLAGKCLPGPLGARS